MRIRRLALAACVLLGACGGQSAGSAPPRRTQWSRAGAREPHRPAMRAVWRYLGWVNAPLPCLRGGAEPEMAKSSMAGTGRVADLWDVHKVFNFKKCLRARVRGGGARARACLCKVRATRRLLPPFCEMHARGAHAHRAYAFHAFLKGMRLHPVY